MIFLRMFKIKHIFHQILKIDCKRYKFKIILNENLTMLNEINFEYHSKQIRKDYNSLIKKLEKDGLNKYLSSHYK